MVFGETFMGEPYSAPKESVRREALTDDATTAKGGTAARLAPSTPTGINVRTAFHT